ncbi:MULTISPECIES: ADP-ribosylglycohydrolase family protein [unclassified Streptomyces]|uniref:ADP-ribosylglycohydrolase family protein n=1 Tax=unclassified Streptomyces TaxID=2593676 RepID=UPI002E2A56EE|nr:ADP-ribosylglycohydrolase family protein [Streptomyces sp. NBC_01423]WSX89344.1 ADP-ribosylglycohydrolase family protein [Streptomyces sp. NBC_00891]WSY03823.1 ADP-ribosylglycohydrolase family protein [Streptomyces sp. NBC_00890]WSZ05449.1 ADP-ribosylglycohydrolase family protein [Streptomyces sp. NBC_00869]WSZ27055.1 ADP-ribosylglycohydrolase family protein [Streptomyces sp. NBC_00870]
MIELPSPVLDSLAGLAFGDAFGDRWFGILRREGPAALETRILPPEPVWRWSDDTAQALVLVRELAEGGGTVDQDRFARRLAEEYAADTHRGYGASMHDVLRRFGAGESWHAVVTAQFEGMGSWGNGAAMRVAPLGAWHAADLDAVADQAARQSVVSHSHPEAAAGAVAVALAAALATRSRGGPAPERADFLREVAALLPDSDVRSGIRIAARMPAHTSLRHAAEVLGSGYRMSGPDTVPFALWCAAGHLDDLEEGLWRTVEGRGDIDTTCAMAGGVIAARTGVAALPAPWHTAREPLPRIVPGAGSDA